MSCWLSAVATCLQVLLDNFMDGMKFPWSSSFQFSPHFFHIPLSCEPTSQWFKPESLSYERLGLRLRIAAEWAMDSISDDYLWNPLQLLRGKRSSPGLQSWTGRAAQWHLGRWILWCLCWCRYEWCNSQACIAKSTVSWNGKEIILD